MKKMSAGLFMLWIVAFSQGVLAADYKVAVRAHHGVEASIEQWQATIDALTAALSEHRFTLIPIVSLEQISKGAGQRHFDFLLTNPSSFVEVNQLYGAQPLVTLNNKRANTAQSRFGSVIFTHASRADIQKISDLQGKTIMSVSERAFGGWRVAWMEMLEQGFDPYKKLAAITFSKSRTQPEVVRSVLARQVDAGVVRTDLLERMENEGKIDMRYLRILNNKDNRDFPFFLSTRLYPEWPLAAMRHVPRAHAMQVKSALLSITRNSEAAVKGKYIGWVEHKDYNSVLKLMQMLKVGPFVNQ